ncbi:uncharacterized protein OCT59_028492 [Rhizophagus irregularis]|uniref:uncharacterized protein n=1 Tax=Rhizophagus irregularis TaxID=588596 RepID=UPI0019F32A86|nr:hypothetical protein OCT59_028492 [Rhizophagus irregularis]GBC52973.2 P-loop containing nucleoside triphosphate hydrolase protein [Rhizophagus irregularis DAOM 181602=DAOM 197198]
MKLLKGILQPNEDQSFYHVVSGEHGTGKTILIKIASNEVGQDDKGTQGGMGVPANIEKFAEEFAKAIDFSFEKCVSFTALLKRNIVGHTVLDILQKDDKDNADKRNYIAVFVSSEGKVPKKMQSQSSWSRAKQWWKSVILINKIFNSKMQYQCRRVKKAIQFSWSYYRTEKSVTDDFLNGQTFEIIEQEILMKVLDKLRTAKLLEGHDLKLTRTAHERFFNNPIEVDEADDIPEKNIFTYHPENSTVTFQSRSIEYCFERVLKKSESVLIKEIC